MIQDLNLLAAAWSALWRMMTGIHGVTGSCRYCGYALISFFEKSWFLCCDHFSTVQSVGLAQAQACHVLQGKKVHKSRIDIYALFNSLFQGVGKDKSDCLVRVESKVCLHSPVQHMQSFKPKRTAKL